MNKPTMKVGFLTLGCKVNQYESEAIAHRCRASGLATADADDICDIYIVNTCTVTAEADRKSCQMIRQLHRKCPAAAIFVTGCSAQRNTQQIASVPGVRAVIGNLRKTECADLALRYAEGTLPDEPVIHVQPLIGASFEPMRIDSFPRTRQYIKIEDGCENRCSYCAICDARGPVRSKPIPEVLEEAAAFYANGCREIVLTGIETASFGKDTGENLGDLLCRLDSLVPEARVRLGSVDPNLFRPAFLEKISSLHTVAPHFHISMQSGSAAVLRRMRRGYNPTQALDALERIRKAIPGVMFTTDMIVGFPGETEKEFAETVQFLEEAQFLKTHIFPFSARKGTEAATLDLQVPQAEKHRRVRFLCGIDEKNRKKLLKARIGTVTQVLFETSDGEQRIGHSGDFIEVRTHSPEDLHGKFASVRITSVEGEYCRGELIHE